MQTYEKSQPIIPSNLKHGRPIPKAILEQQKFILAIIFLKTLPHENTLQAI